MLYAGIGPRKTPPHVLNQMAQIGKILADSGFILSTGAGEGADEAWEEFVKPNQSRIFLAKPKKYRRYAIVPTVTQEQWDFCNKHFKLHRNNLDLSTQNEYIQMLFCRNLNILLGEDLQVPVDFVAYWYDKDYPTGWAGGTGHTVSMAYELEIPCFNIWSQRDQQAMDDFVTQLLEKKP